MDLILGVSAKKPKKQEEEIQLALSEAGYTCACCGLQSKPNPKSELLEEKRGYMYLVMDDEGKEKVVCTLCYFSMNMDMLTEPRFIYYPWLSQEQLNYLFHYCYTVLQINLVPAHVQQASKCILQLNSKFAVHLTKFDPTLINEPLKLIRLLKWLQMEEPENYLARNDKYLKSMRLIPFTVPIRQKDIIAAFTYSGTLLYEEDLKDKWQAVYLDHVKKRQQGVVV